MDCLSFNIFTWKLFLVFQVWIQSFWVNFRMIEDQVTRAWIVPLIKNKKYNPLMSELWGVGSTFLSQSIL